MAVGVSEQTMWRIETGQTSTNVSTVAVLSDLYDVPTEMRRVFRDLATETKIKSQAWWHPYGEAVPDWLKPLLGFEQTARLLRIFAPLLIPGLFQCAEYAGAVIRAGLPELEEGEVQRRVELRLSRQRLLTRSFPAAPRVEVVIGESLLIADAQPKGTMRRQVWQLLKATELDNVSLRMLSVSTGPHRASGAGSFTLLDFAEENGNAAPPTVYSENLTGAIYLEKPKEIQAYQEVWAALASAALSEQDTIQELSKRLGELNERER